MAESSNPPGLLRKSSMNPLRCPPDFCFKESMAVRMSLSVMD